MKADGIKRGFAAMAKKFKDMKVSPPQIDAGKDRCDFYNPTTHDRSTK